MKLACETDCTGCMACIDACHHQALESYRGKDGHLYVKCNDVNCIDCGLCEKTCPVVSGFNYEEIQNNSRPYAAWADDEIRKKSASGGVFTSIANSLVAKGWYVVGTSMDGYDVKPLITNNNNDIQKLQGTKYQQADFSGIYRQIKKILKSGQNVLFCGTSCQIAGLISFLGENRFQDSLLTIDLICGGFPSHLLLDTIEKYYKNRKLSYLSFRDKKEGWKSNYKMTLYFDDDQLSQKDSSVSDFFYCNMASAFTHRESCLNCRFTHASRKSDITIGDFWGDRRFTDQHEKGISVAIAHSSKGVEYLINSGLHVETIKWNDFLAYNRRMVIGKHATGKRGYMHKFTLFYIRLMDHLGVSPILNANGVPRIPWILLRYLPSVYRKYLLFRYKNNDIEIINQIICQKTKQNESC